ncbi:hypothetical protein BU16DRAFT_117646 [Lophium mytilinum]|uniref:Uncharacterized protein n=1 Tax=Lophium mytilinum TaxID=390894 RepID=A0A6A6QH39_9PEZI|nr:hypothetical protein BU16DRAFT_117646 [Lophium mytilinum]
MADHNTSTRSPPVMRGAARMLNFFSFLWDTKFQLTLLTVSSFSSKLLHLYSHRISLPIILTTLYLPTFLLPDALLVILSKTLLFRQDRSKLEVPRKIAGALLTLITTSASAAQVSFYLETGGEVQWLAAGNFANDPAGMKLLMSGFPKFALAFLCFVAISWLLTPRYYDFIDRVFGDIASAFKALRQVVFKKNTGYSKVSRHSDDDEDSDEEGH